MNPILYFVIPCYNEETVLPVTAPFFLDKIEELIGCGKVSPNSKILFVDDGSSDNTWRFIDNLSKDYIEAIGLRLSRNYGHQNALMAGLMEAKEFCDICISVDCDGQDDINASDKMVDEYLSGADIVYGVMDNRKNNTCFKCLCEKMYHKLLGTLGVKIPNYHTDYRLLSKRVLEELSGFKEVNLYLRGVVPLIGFKSTSVCYERHRRLAGKSKYAFKKTLKLNFDGIISLTEKPIHIITVLGLAVSLVSGVGIIWTVIAKLFRRSEISWVLMILIMCFWGGIQLLSIGIIGEYVGKTYLQVKKRPIYIIKERTKDNKNSA